eukprot:TRINITY_DN2800_c0_g1_i1.p1 TRINITY_DN2800_c0_g1~~TRINITY_DN2800_c0_g1_i1.p1  ORF type:complete len:380 (-),score=140.34 TRINITY_DN2800_c0_g1_i1:176-1315(-)
MPPKASKKEVNKMKQKVVEDKTFGLKNKNKSKKVQNFVQSVQKQVDNNFEKKKAAGPAVPAKSKAEIEKEKIAEIASIMKVAQTKVPNGVDPKSVLCEFHKQGICTKGAKCKFSHDLNIGRKVEKIDIYTDRRGLEEEKETDTMDKWSQEKLDQVIKEKHAGEKKGREAIVCKYFLDAIEKKKYGWFWICPGGGDQCQYLHALPPGYVLKEKKEEPDEEEEEIPLEDKLEEERAKIVNRTPLTLELFLKWKADKVIQKKKKEEEEEAKRKAELKPGKVGQMSGREMFTFNPELFIDDDDAIDEYEQVENIDGPIIELSATGTSISLNIKEGGGQEDKERENEDGESHQNGEENGEVEDIADKLGGVEVDESLFTEEDEN